MRRRLLQGVAATILCCLIFTAPSCDNSFPFGEAPFFVVNPRSGSRQAPPQEKWIIVNTGLPYNHRFIFNEVTFPDTKHGWIAGGSVIDPDGGSIIHTTDAGETWHIQVDGKVAGLSHISFADSLHGWFVGGYGSVGKTTNGGSSWQVQQIGNGGHLIGSFFLSQQLGWTVGDNESIFQTTDGGNSWHQQLSGDTVGLGSIFFTDSLNGWAVGNFFGSSMSGIILRTMNGGITWSEQMTTPKNIWKVIFIDKIHGWIPGTEGTVYSTSDGGNSWNLTQANTVTSIYSVAFIDSLHGWGCGSFDIVIRTTNGGKSWDITDPLNSGWQSPMLAMTFSDAHNGWIVGMNAFILHFIRP